MKSIAVEINGQMTPVCFADDVDKVTTEMRERHEKEMEQLESHWRATLESREQELREQMGEKNRRVLEHMATPRNFQDEICNVLRTCEREGNPAPAYDFLRGMSAGWWLCHEIESPSQESIEDRMRKWMNKPKDEK